MSDLRRFGKSLSAIVVVALVLRLIIVLFFYAQQSLLIRDHWHFGWETGRIARSIAMGKGFSSPLFTDTGPTAWMGPVYPFLLAGVFKLLGVYSKASSFAILSLNSLFSALTCLPIFYAARRAFGSTVALRASWLWALFPYAIYLPAAQVWETVLSALLLTTLFALTLHMEDIRNPWAWLGYGALWGLTGLTNPATLILLIPLTGWACYRLHAKGLSWSRPAAMVSLAAVLVVTPWTIRNYETFHQFVPLRDNFWLEAWLGNHGHTQDWFDVLCHPTENAVELAEYGHSGEITYLGDKRAETLSFISAHPGNFLVTSLRRFAFTWTGYWSFEPSYLRENPFDIPNILLTVALTMLMLAGLYHAFRKGHPSATVFALLLLFFPLIYYVTHASPKYRHPLDPEIATLAVVGASHAFRRREALRE